MDKGKLKVAFNNVVNADKQRLVTYVAYVVVVVVAVFISFWNVIFGTDNFNVGRFVANLSFNIAIAVLILVLAWRDGELTNQTRKKGLLHDARQTFDKIVKIVVDRFAFQQWNDNFYEVKHKEFIMNLLSTFGIYDYDYLLISENDLKKLQNEPLENITYRYKGKEYIVSLDAITESQYYKLLKIRKNPPRYERLPFTFFLSRQSVDEYQRYAKEQERNKKQKVIALSYRVVSLLIFSGIIAFSIVNPIKSSASQVAFDTAGRMFQFVTSMFMGYTIAYDEGKREIESLDYKCQIIQAFDDDVQNGIFVPKDRNEVIAEKVALLREQRIKENGINHLTMQGDQIKEVELEMTPEQYQNFITNTEEKHP